MSEGKLDSCKECGMPIPPALMGFCPFCRAEERRDIHESGLNQAEKCSRCAKIYSYSDEWFWEFWMSFDNPVWLSEDFVWCTQCILSQIKIENPDFEATGLKPDFYFVWKLALKNGIDLGPKFLNIESTDVIRRLHDCFVSREDMVKWLNSDCRIDEAEAWSQLFNKFDVAMSWRDAGFTLEQAEDWSVWDCTAEEVVVANKNGANYPPHPDFKKFGYKFSEAIFLDLNEFEPYEDEGSEYFIGTWLPSGFSSIEIVKLRDELKSLESDFVAVHSRSQSRLKDDEWTYEFWEALPNHFEQLKTLGLPITPQNLLKYWGLSSKEILNVIDAGGKPGVAAEVIRQGGSISKLGIIERLIDLGMSSSSATLLSRRGFLQKHLKQLESGFELSTLNSLTRLLDSGSSLKVEEAFGWLAVEKTVGEIGRWLTQGFTPQEAVEWAKENFSPEIARRWKDSGADSPVAAKRRRGEGLNP